MSVCENCLHNKVCGKYVATGGYVKECEYFMDNYTATEPTYKNGYKKGYEDGKKECKQVIALLENGEYFISGDENIRDFLITYAEHIGTDVKVFRILVDSGEMTTQELVTYLNNRCYSEETIGEIYALGNRLG